MPSHLEPGLHPSEHNTLYSALCQRKRDISAQVKGTSMTVEDRSIFDYTFDATGLYAYRNYIDEEDCRLLGEDLERLTWRNSDFERTNRIDSLHARSDLMMDVARRLLNDPIVDHAMTYPPRVLESYALSRMSGGRLPLHGGSSERLVRFGAPEATDISCAYLFRAGRMYTMRLKALIYIDDILSIDDGPLVYVEGSHKANFPFFRSVMRDESFVSNSSLIRPVMVRRGTCILLNEALIHGALMKKTTKPRRLIAITLGPSFVTDWNELTIHTDSVDRSGYVVPDTEDFQ